MTIQPDQNTYSEQPFFSIGLPTYNRPDLLKQTLRSILAQSFPNFEVIVGNDYTSQPVTADILGIKDARIRFINNPQNLGEIENMNSLLKLSRGKYFTWQFDDDLYAPDFLQAVHSVLINFDFPPCVYTSFGYIHGTSYHKTQIHSAWPADLLTGKKLLKKYLAGKLKILGFCGVFETDSLKKMQGAKKLCNHAIGAHSEHLIIVQTAIFDRIAYINRPLVLYRTHENSWSYKNAEVDIYKQAGRDFVRESIKVLIEPALIDDFEQNFSNLLKLSADIVLGKLIARDGYLNKQELMEYLLSIKKQLGIIKGTVLYTTALACLKQAGKEHRSLNVIKAKFKVTAPIRLVKFAQIVRAFISRYKHWF